MNAIALALSLLSAGAWWPTAGSGLPLSGGTVVGAAVNACSQGTGMDVDGNGMQGCNQIADTAPARAVLLGKSAWSGATVNTAGADLQIMAGLGRRIIAMTAANCGGDTVVATLDNVAGAGNTCTETGANGALTFDCTGETNAVCATNVATCLTALVGISATANSPTSGTVYVQRANDEPAKGTIFFTTSDGTCANITQGVDGKIAVGGGTIYQGSNGVLNIDNGSGISLGNAGTLGGSGWSTTGTFAPSPGMSTIVVGAAATTIALVRNGHIIDCDAGGNTISTITGIAVGAVVVLKFIDASCTLTNTNDGAANTLDLVGAGNITSADDTMLLLTNDGSNVQQIAPAAVN